ncbi:MAG: aminotransferase class III-fold pyridoxal phosphate-dependent enzyme [Lewinellaceae bacterium]|nr:aminotransferase class III-fold pyridoxal phosphate-dependent enzyme [Lewinellaceae bacterium]
MELFDVYPRYSVRLNHAKGAYVFDDAGQAYLDLYGGHGVISIGHTHPRYVQALSEQLNRIGFYSNSVDMPIQDMLAEKLGAQSGYPDYRLFLCNSGAEANENALKLASFHTGKNTVITYRNSFHGRTAAALAVTDNSKLQAPINQNNFPVTFIELNQEAALEQALDNPDVCAVIIEGIQGVGGLDQPTPGYLKFLQKKCAEHGVLLILDEIQCGYARSGKFFAHQHAGIRPDIITVAKGMANGFPIGGVLIQPGIEAKHGMLGTTFGGNQLACAAAISVLDTLEEEAVLENVNSVSQKLLAGLENIPGILRIKGQGLMLGVELPYPVKELRSKLLHEHRIFTGSSNNPNLLRILPPLTITWQEIEPLLHVLKTELS